VNVRHSVCLESLELLWKRGRKKPMSVPSNLFIVVDMVEKGVDRRQGNNVDGGQGEEEAGLKFETGAMWYRHKSSVQNTLTETLQKASQGTLCFHYFETTTTIGQQTGETLLVVAAFESSNVCSWD